MTRRPVSPTVESLVYLEEVEVHSLKYNIVDLVLLLEFLFYCNLSSIEEGFIALSARLHFQKKLIVVRFFKLNGLKGF